MTATALQCDREAAWPHRDQVAYKESDKEAWMRGTYDRSRIIQGFARHRHDSTREMAEALELLRQAMNALGTVDNNDPLEPIADNGMTVWDGMRSESLRLWPHYRTFLATLQGTDR